MITGTQFGRYEISGKIGEGGMGEVYSARDAELGRNIAIKLLPNEFTSDVERKSRFRQEARVVSALNHPNIITIYEIGENEHGSFLATEFINGKTLRAILKHQELSLPSVLKIIEQAANALAAAHDARIIHRDIKPENIMVRSDAIVKVLDFGLAKPVCPIEEEGENSKTIPGTVMGSARYMSPEQARGLEVDVRTDIWSIGVVLYEMLAGETPFKGATIADTIASVICTEPEPLSHYAPDLPAELYRIVRKALQKEREERYQSVKDLALDVKELLYDLEHVNSAERIGHSTSSPNFNENPTMIHSTNSANHPTGKTTFMTSAHSLGAAPKRRNGFFRLAAIASGLMLIAAIGIGAFRWFGAETTLAAAAFEKPQISRVKTDGKVNMPAISPDGKYMSYVSGEFGSHSLVVRQISTDSIVTVVPTTNLGFTAVTFSPDGDYVYYCQTRSDFSVNTLFRVPTLGGTPKKLIEDVDSGVTFSPDGKQFAFMRHTTKVSEDFIFIADTASLEMQPLIGSRQTDFDFFSTRLAWSPDGMRILLGAGKRQSGFGGEMAIVEISVRDGKIWPINAGTFFKVGNFAWFADGSGFLFSARETLTSPVQIWRASYPGMNLHQITNDFNDYGDVGLSADGKTILTVKGDMSSSLWRLEDVGAVPVHITGDNRNPEGNYGLGQMSNGRLVYTRSEAKQSDIWTSDFDGKNARSLTAGAGFSVGPAVTPDGRFIVFNLQEPKSSRIWRMDADGSNRIRLTDESPDYMDFNPQLTADGKSIIFQRQFIKNDRGVLMKISIGGGPATVFYEHESYGIFMPRLSRDGKRIAFSRYDLNNFDKKLIIATIDNGAISEIERELEYNLINQFAWSPDSKSLTVLSSRAGIPNIWRQPLDGSEPKPITDFKNGRIFNFTWGNDGKNLLIARGNTNNDLLLVKDDDRNSNRDTPTRTSRNAGNRRPPFLETVFTQSR